MLIKVNFQTQENIGKLGNKYKRSYGIKRVKQTEVNNYNCKQNNYN